MRSEFAEIRTVAHIFPEAPLQLMKQTSKTGARKIGAIHDGGAIV